MKIRLEFGKNNGILLQIYGKTICENSFIILQLYEGNPAKMGNVEKGRCGKREKSGIKNAVWTIKGRKQRRGGGEKREMSRRNLTKNNISAAAAVSLGAGNGVTCACGREAGPAGRMPAGMGPPGGDCCWSKTYTAYKSCRDTRRGHPGGCPLLVFGTDRNGKKKA